jgi:indolepyruvate ferredoxin oxidoreductase alpha subunit
MSPAMKNRTFELLVEKKKGDKELLLGNEAIVRGAIEAGVGFAATYPGTPSSEIGDTLFQIAKDLGMYFEFSVNEKVAMEGAIAAAESGVRALVFMKHVGLNVASDPLMTLAYMGIESGLVMVSADDPSLHSSQNEQDNRYYARMANIPLLEPSTPQEAKDMVRLGYEISESTQLPVLLRTTTMVSHVSGVVGFGRPKEMISKGHFKRNIKRFVCIPENMRVRRLDNLKNIKKAAELSERSEFNKVVKKEGSFGIITSGAAFNYTMQIVSDMKLDASVLKLGMTHPVPRDIIRNFMDGKEFIVVLEELDPYLEKEVNLVAHNWNISLPIYGKLTKHFPLSNEYNIDVVKKGLSEILELSVECDDLKLDIELPRRLPLLCPGCPHQSTYYCVKKALSSKDVIYCSDIGCYGLGVYPPHETADIALCMGSSIGTANGFSIITDQLIVAFIGDSTFFHSGISGLINAAYHGRKLIYIILDNRTTAMTGHQPHPGTGMTGMQQNVNKIYIEEVVKGCGVDFIRTVNPSDTKAMIQAVKDAAEHDGVAVIIARSPCILLSVRDKDPDLLPHTIHQEKCIKCYTCITQYACPAFYKDDEGGVHIDQTLCNGCGVCPQICPTKAILPKEKEGGA